MGSHLQGKVAVEHLTLGPPFNMVGKFIFFGLLLSAPLAITGLKCYQDINFGTPGARLTECPDAGANKKCGIMDFDGSGQALKTCAKDSSEVGCWTENGGKWCVCTTDGCNESFDTAGGMRAVSTATVTFAVILSYLFLQ